MTDTRTFGKLAEALAKAQGEMGNAIKDKANPFFKSKYADLTSCFGAMRKPFSDNGLSVVQTMSHRDNVNFLITTLFHSSGEFVESAMPLPDIKDIQKLGSAITYLRRYMLCSIAGIAPADDDDGNTASKEAKLQEYERSKKKLAEEIKICKDLLMDFGDEELEKKTLAWAQVERIEDIPLGKLQQINRNLTKKAQEGE